MWRFITISFAFLGWAFYHLSGGADYEPRLQSIQARAKLDNVRPLARPEPVAVVELPGENAATDDSDAVTRALSTLDDLDLTKDTGFKVTLAAVEQADVPKVTFEADTQKTQILVETPGIEPETVQVEEPEPFRDIREVTGTVVNMRDGPSTFYIAIGKLRQGDQIEVLDTSSDGWLKIRTVTTGQEGWMADWLATAAAN